MKSLRFFLCENDYFFDLSEALGEMVAPGVSVLFLGQALPNPWTVASTGTRGMKCNIVFW